MNLLKTLIVKIMVRQCIKNFPNSIDLEIDTQYIPENPKYLLIS